jgi:hypothetical protein
MLYKKLIKLDNFLISYPIIFNYIQKIKRESKVPFCFVRSRILLTRIEILIESSNITGLNQAIL